jgi:iron complex transport system substrate-binding protein
MATKLKESHMTTSYKATFTKALILLGLSMFILAACSSPAATETEVLLNSSPEATSPPEPEPTKVEPTEVEPTEAATDTPIPEPEAEPLIFIDGLDREVTLEEPAQKIVSMAPSNTEILFAVGAGDQVIGRDEFSDYPDQAASLPSVGGGFGDYNLEAIVDLEPDLVLAAEINTPEQVTSIEDLGLTVYLLPNPTTLEEMYENLFTVAEMTGHSSGAEELVDELRRRVSNIESLVGTNIASDMEGQYLQLSIEELLVRDPQVILLGDAAYGITPESLLERTGWSNLSAVVNNRIYSFDDNLVSRPGPRLVDGLEELARLLHPELFDY